MSFYVGIGLPDEQSLEPYLKDDLDLIRDSIIQILMTKPGQRLFCPDFGSMLWTRVFEPNDSGTIQLVKQDIATALRMWEPRVVINRIDVMIEENEMRVYLKVQVKRLQKFLELTLDLSRDKFTGLAAFPPTT
jgi:phage baseplate assembly protein W